MTTTHCRIGRAPVGCAELVGEAHGLPAVPTSARRAVDEVVPQAVRVALEATLASLDARERKVLELRFGLNGGEALTLDEVGRQLGGISRERVRQIEVVAMAKLRDGRASPALAALVGD